MGGVKLIKGFGKLQEQIAADEEKLISSISKKIGDSIIEEIEDDIETIQDAANSISDSTANLREQIAACEKTAQLVANVSEQITAMPASVEAAEKAINGAVDTIETRSDGFISTVVRATEDLDLHLKNLENHVGTALCRALGANAELTACMQKYTQELQQSENVTKDYVAEMHELGNQSVRICEDLASINLENQSKILENLKALEICTSELRYFTTICKEAKESGQRYCTAADTSVSEMQQTAASMEKTIQEAVAAEIQRMECVVNAITERLSNAVDSYIAQLNVTSQDFSTAYERLSERSDNTEANVQAIKQEFTREAEQNIAREKESRTRFWIGLAMGGGILLLQLAQLIL
jgi:hypothetical protein